VFAAEQANLMAFLIAQACLLFADVVPLHFQVHTSFLHFSMQRFNRGGCIFFMFFFHAGVIAKMSAWSCVCALNTAVAASEKSGVEGAEAVAAAATLAAVADNIPNMKIPRKSKYFKIASTRPLRPKSRNDKS
jgi:hypothetical protein